MQCMQHLRPHWVHERPLTLTLTEAATSGIISPDFPQNRAVVPHILCGIT